MTAELWGIIAASSVAAAALWCLALANMPAIMQQCGYSGDEFLDWYYVRGNMLLGRHALLTLCLVLLCSLFDLCFSFLGAKWANLISSAPFIGMCVLFFFSNKRALKVPFKRTGRIVRVCVVYWLVLSVFMFLATVGLTYAANAANKRIFNLFRYVPVLITPLLFPAFFAFANNIAKAYDIPHNRAFIKRAENKLRESSCIKVGITGSYGKTSVKNMLATMLKEKYRVISSPASYNTPLGIALTVKEQGCDCDIFIAEMGARRAGDIRRLCKIVSPQFGIVTAVGSQHLQTFGSLENIAREKGILAECTEKCILGATAAKSIHTESALSEGELFSVENVVLSEHGTSFTLRLKEERIPVETPLLGRGAAEDIALSSAMCLLLGMSVEEIAAAIPEIQPVPHRLEKSVANGVTILDDSYNCSEESAKAAVETLKLFSGRKWIITPGIVELGILRSEKNKQLGASLVGLDNIILVGETLVLAVKRGYLEAGGESEKLRVVSSLEKAKKLLSEELKEGDTVLFLNDLPDKYAF